MARSFLKWPPNALGTSLIAQSTYCTPSCDFSQAQEATRLAVARFFEQTTANHGPCSAQASTSDKRRAGGVSFRRPHQELPASARAASFPANVRQSPPGAHAPARSQVACNHARTVRMRANHASDWVGRASCGLARPPGRTHGTVTGFPSAIAPRFLYTAGSIVMAMGRTAPSTRLKCTTPSCQLLNCHQLFGGLRPP